MGIWVFFQPDPIKLALRARGVNPALDPGGSGKAVLAERIFHTGRKLPEFENGSGRLPNGSGAASRLLIFTKKISKTAPEAASRLRQKIQKIARSASPEGGWEDRKNDVVDVGGGGRWLTQKSCY